MPASIDRGSSSGRAQPFAGPQGFKTSVSDQDSDRFVPRGGNSFLRTADLIGVDGRDAEDLVREALLKVARR
jgi:hypothetical protein